MSVSVEVDIRSLASFSMALVHYRFLRAHRARMSYEDFLEARFLHANRLRDVVDEAIEFWNEENPEAQVVASPQVKREMAREVERLLDSDERVLRFVVTRKAS